MNRIGDLGLLLGIFMIIQQFGTLEFTTVFEEINKGTVSVNTLNAIGILLFIGAMGKSAQIPLFTWLPDAMAGPTPVSALIHAATMVTAGIYLVIRCSALYVLSPIANEVIIWTGLSTAIVAALIGLKQNDIKKVLAYSTVSQLGFMFVALGCGAYTTALFHVTTHAFFKALLFLGAGSVIHGMHHEQDIRKMGGLKSKMPITHFTFLIGTLAITGFPFLSGFFSKDEILTIAFNHNIVVYILLVGSALLTGIYMFRLLFVTFYGEYRNHHYSFDKVHESPRLMTLPLIILAVLSILGGLLNLPHYLQHEGGILQNWLKPILGHTHSAQHEISFNTEMILVSIAVLVFVTALLLTRMRYISRKHIPQEQTPTGVLGMISNKFYFDEIYDFVFVKPFETMSIWLQQVFELKIVSKISYGIHDILRFFGGLNKKIQNGNIEYYLMFMDLKRGTIAIFY
jgi:NADH-quinone oxidoreductase subunit L